LYGNRHREGKEVLMDIGKIERTRHIELPARETAPAKPERQPFRRTEPVKPTPERVPEKVPAGPAKDDDEGVA
jgi:hypothetical protein